MGNKTSISSGLVVYKLLSEDREVSGMVTKIFPVATDKAECPYVVFRAKESEQQRVKNPIKPDDTVLLEVCCCAKEYEESVALAEAVRGALDRRRGETEGVTMRSCLFTDREETYEDDAYVQVLTFEIKV